MLVQENPSTGLAAAERALALAREQHDREAEAAALHALGFAQYALGDSHALRTIRRAVRVAEQHGDSRRAALARRNLAVYLAYAGKASAGLREIDAACAALRGIDRARSEVFRLAVLGLAGRLPASAVDSGRALRTLRRARDRIWEARLLHNRGTLHMDLGNAATARKDLSAARAIYAELGAEAAVDDTDIKLARLRHLEGAPTECLAELDAIDVGSLSDWASCWLFLTRAEVLVGLRLLPEARTDLARFVETSARAGAVDSVNKAQLAAARLALLAGDPESAASLAVSAGRSFAAHRQPAYWAGAASLTLAASVARGAVRPSLLRTGLKAAAKLAATGYAVEELRARQLVARAAAEFGSLRLARREAEAASSLRRGGTVADRVEFWHVEALLRLAEGDALGGERALRRGLQLLEEYRAALGAVELRVTASALGVELAEHGLRLALSTGKPEKVLAWAERMRANALRLPPVRPPADRRLRARQAELRRVAAQIREAESRGSSTRALRTQQTDLEQSIRASARLARGGRAASTAAPRTLDAARALGDRALVEYIEVDGALRALTLSRGRLAMRELGESATATTELEWLRFALGRRARRNAKASGPLDNASAAAARLDRLLVQPLLAILGDADLVVVPTGALHVLPWAMLPSLSGRALVSAPSLSVWLRLARHTVSRGRKTVLVAGPRLQHSGPEVRDLAELYPNATVLSDTAATAAAALRALDGAALAHVACHGHFRSDSPLFSSLELADGPLTAFDLQRLQRAPAVLVLSSCDLALSDHHPGDELLGLSSALLSMGTRTIVASVVPVPDREARRLMLSFHKELSKGLPPAVALARAQANPRRSSLRLAPFVCLGSG